MKNLVALLFAGLILLPTRVFAERTQVRWFVGLESGTREEQIEPQEKLVEKFNALQDEIELVLEIAFNAQAYDMLTTRIASGNAPDIVGPVDIRGRDRFKDFWLDLQALVDKTAYDLSDFDPALVKFYRVEDEGLSGLPFGIYPSFLFINKNLFDEADRPYPPQKYGEPYVDEEGNEKEWNMDTLKELALKLTVDKNGNNATSPDFDPKKIAQFGFGAQQTDVRGYGTFFGPGSFVDKDGNAQIPEVWIDAWKWFRDAMWKDYFHPNGVNGNRDDMGWGNWFQTGHIAMGSIQLWYVDCCMEERKNRWDTAVIPSYKGNTTAKMHAETFMIMKDSKVPDAAFKVLSYLLSHEGAAALLPVYGAMPARLSMQDEYFRKFNEEKFPGQMINWQVVIDSVAYPDVPSHESWMPSSLEANNTCNEFWTKVTDEPELDLEAEIDMLKIGLQRIFDAAK